MTVIMALLGVFLALLLGNVILFLFDKKGLLSPLENLAVSFLIGEGALTTLLFWSFFFDLPFRVYLFGLVIFVLAIVKELFFTKFRTLKALLWNLRLKSRFQSIDFRKILLVLLLLALLFKLSYSFVETLSKPEYSWDACGNHTLAGKTYYWASLEKPNKLVWAISHTNNYPKMVGLMHFWLFSWMGEANDQWSKIIFPLGLLSFLSIFYVNLRSVRGRLGSLFFAYLLTSTPFFLYHSTIGYLEFSIAIFFASGMLYFYRYVREKKEVYFWLFSIFTGLTAWIKLEGKALFALGFILLLFYLWREFKGTTKDRIIKILQYSSVYLVVGLPWQIFTILNQMPSREKFANYFPHFFELHYKMYLWLFTQGTWGIFWLIFTAALIFYFKRLALGANKYLLLALFLFYCLIIFIYQTNYDAYPGFESAFNRSWHAIYPLCVFALGCWWGGWEELTRK